MKKCKIAPTVLCEVPTFAQPGQVKYTLQTREHRIRGWRAGLVAESEHCSSRAAEFGSQPPHHWHNQAYIRMLLSVPHSPLALGR